MNPSGIGDSFYITAMLLSNLTHAAPFFRSRYFPDQVIYRTRKTLFLSMGSLDRIALSESNYCSLHVFRLLHSNSPDAGAQDPTDGLLDYRNPSADTLAAVRLISLPPRLHTIMESVTRLLKASESIHAAKNFA
jgi:hypothetical protein